jgi:hypothetical protein
MYRELNGGLMPPALQTTHTERPYVNDPAARSEAAVSGVSWAAVVAGAFVSAALSLSLLALGAGAGLGSISPWSNVGASATAVGVGALVWLIILQILSSGTGGYLAGRLRTKWVNVHTDEVYFRDTAHGFLVWAVGLVLAAAFLTSAASYMVGTAAQTSAPTRSEGPGVDSNRYFVDSLFRSPKASSEASETPLVSEVGIIFARSLKQGGLSPQDKAYVTEAVAARTGVSPAEADRRVSDAFARDQQAADDARKAVAHSLFWLFVALLIGAFSASFAATIGGRQRDHVRMPA